MSYCTCMIYVGTSWHSAKYLLLFSHIWGRKNDNGTLLIANGLVLKLVLMQVLRCTAKSTKSLFLISVECQTFSSWVVSTLLFVKTQNALANLAATLVKGTRQIVLVTKVVYPYHTNLWASVVLCIANCEVQPDDPNHSFLWCVAANL